MRLLRHIRGYRTMSPAARDNRRMIKTSRTGYAVVCIEAMEHHSVLLGLDSLWPIN
jgi:hypothetical protein